jgi:hypothetical protein
MDLVGTGPNTITDADELEFTSNTAETDRRPRFAHP